MEHEDCNKRYFGFYLIVYGILGGLDFSGNLITFYLFYECMTLLSPAAGIPFPDTGSSYGGIEISVLFRCAAHIWHCSACTLSTVTATR